MSTEPTGHRYERDGDIVTVVIDHGPINIVDPELIESMITHLPTVLDDPTVRCVVVRGKDRIFVGGANLRVMQRLDPDTYRDMRRWVVVQRLLELAPKPVIAALNGHALGGGAELSLACDLRILHAKAMFGFPETDLGIFPGAGGSQRLPRLVGAHRAKRFIIDATKFTAAQALHEGLVDLVAGDDRFGEVRDRSRPAPAHRRGHGGRGATRHGQPRATRRRRGHRIVPRQACCAVRGSMS
jgi:enoyl-CoA hydratase